jgi:transcription elongation GreA/GreB family factor
MSMDKRAVFKSVLEKFREDLRQQERAAGAARDGATGASYLARGHAMQFEALVDDLRTLEAYRLPDYEADEAIGTGALVEMVVGRKGQHYFILPRGGGIFVEHAGVEIAVLNPRSPLAKSLNGHRVGDRFLLPGSDQQGRIRSVC